MARIKICDICGDKGYMQHIITCHSCKRASQHIYCMHVQLHEFPDIWYCDTCRPQASEVQEEKMLRNSLKNECVTYSSDLERAKCQTKERLHLHEDGSQIICRQQKQRNQKFRKLKFLLSEEIPSTNRATSCYGTADSVAPNCHDNHAKDVYLAPPDYLRKGLTNLSKSLSLTPTKVANSPIKEIVNADAGLSHRKVLTREDATHDTKVNIQNYDVSDGRELYSAPVKNPDSKENVRPLRLLMNWNEELVNCPLPKACWKGDFDVFGMPTYVYSEIQAHFPSKVYHKVYEIAEKLPVKLKLNMLPRQDAWPFKSSRPNNYDIGLYFFASHESSRQNYFQILEHIDLCDLVLKAWVEDVELLIYPSKQLEVASHRFHLHSPPLRPVYQWYYCLGHPSPLRVKQLISILEACQRGIGGEVYLWGVFRKRRTNHLDMPSPTAAADTKINAHSLSTIIFEGKNQDVDMEIDMEGGKEVGKVDIPTGIADAPRGFPFGRPISCEVNYVSRKDAAPGFALVRPISCALGFPLQSRRISCEAGPVYRPADAPPGFLSRRPIKWEASSSVFNPADAAIGLPLQRLISCEASPVCMPANAYPGLPFLSPDSKPLAILPLFPQKAEYTKADDCKKNQIVSADLSLRRPSYVMNHNVWVPRASTASEEDDGCDELPLKL